MSEAASLQSRVASGLRWSSLDLALQQVSRFVITIVLTRLVEPQDFGVLAMALVFTQLASLMGDLGLGPALVQRQNVEQRHVSTAFTLTALVGLGLTLVLAVGSWPIAAFYDEPRLQPILLLLSVNYFFRGVGSTAREMLRRAMMFRAFAVLSLASIALGGIVGVVLAVLDFGTWALVGSVLIESIVGAMGALLLATHLKVWRFGWGIDRSALSDLSRFGVLASGARLAHYGASNLDNLIVGKVLGATALGLYNLAYRLMLFPVLRFSEAIANVMTPAFATIQSDVERVQRAYASAVRSCALVSFPVSVLIVTTAPVLIPVVFGRSWSEATVVVQILALNGVRLAIMRLNSALFEATGHPGKNFVVLFVTLICYAIAFAIGVNWGIEGVAWGYTIAGFLLVPLDYKLLTKAMNSSVLDLMRPLGAITLSSCVMTASGVLTMYSTTDMADALRLITTTVVSIGIYVLTLRIVKPGLMSSSLRTLLSR